MLAQDFETFCEPVIVEYTHTRTHTQTHSHTQTFCKYGSIRGADGLVVQEKERQYLQWTRITYGKEM
jgi:hypothetical protein